MLKSYPMCLYVPGSADDLSLRLEQQLRSPVVIAPSMAVSWGALAVKLEGVLKEVAYGHQTA
jgi:hypothetical protein